MNERTEKYKGLEIKEVRQDGSVRLLIVEGREMLRCVPQVGRTVNDGRGGRVPMWFDCNMIDKTFVDHKGRVHTLKSHEVTDLGFLLWKF